MYLKIAQNIAQAITTPRYHTKPNTTHFTNSKLANDVVEIKDSICHTGLKFFEALKSGQIKLIPREKLLAGQSIAIRSAYNDLERSIIARDPRNNNYKVLNSAANKYLRNNLYKTEEEKLAYLKRLKYYFDLRGKDGEISVGTDFIDFITSAYTEGMDWKTVEDFAHLVGCSRGGKISRDIFFGDCTDFKHADGVNPNILKDIALLLKAQKEGKNAIDLFIPKERDWSKIKPGDMHYSKFWDRVYLVDENHCEHEVAFGLDREVIYKLFAPVSRFFSAQNGAGSCYELAAYNSILSDPKVATYLTRCITKENGKLIIRMPKNSTPNNMFAGKFKDFTSEGSVQTELKGLEYEAKDKRMTTRSNPLIQALETLYGTHRKYIWADLYIKHLKRHGQDWQKAYKHLLQHMDETIIRIEDVGYKCYNLKEFNKHQQELYTQGKLNKKPKAFITVEDYYKEGGFSSEILNYFLKGRCNMKSVQWNELHANENIDKVRELLSTSTVRCFGTKSKRGKTDSNYLNKDRGLVYSHAYSVVDYDKDNDIVTYVNPWNTALIYKMKLTELMKYMAHVDVAQYRY